MGDHAREDGRMTTIISNKKRKGKELVNDDEIEERPIDTGQDELPFGDEQSALAFQVGNIVGLLEEINAFTSFDERRHYAAQIAAVEGMTYALFADKEWSLKDIKKWNLGSLPSRELHRALSKPRLRWMMPELSYEVLEYEEGDSLELEVCVSHGKTPYHYHWYRDDRLINGQVDSILHLDHLEMGDAGRYSFRVTDQEGNVVKPPRAWEVRVLLLRPDNQLSAHERWYKKMEQMNPRPVYTLHFESFSPKIKLPEIGLEVLLPMFYSTERGYIMFRVTANGKERNLSTIIPCSKWDLMQDIIELRTLLARPREEQHNILTQRCANAELLRSYIRLRGGRASKRATANELVQYIVDHFSETDATSTIPVDMVPGSRGLPSLPKREPAIVSTVGVAARGYLLPKGESIPNSQPPDASIKAAGLNPHLPYQRVHRVIIRHPSAGPVIGGSSAPIPKIKAAGLNPLLPSQRVHRVVVRHSSAGPAIGGSSAPIQSDSIMQNIDGRLQHPTMLAASEVKVSVTAAAMPPPSIHRIAMEGTAISMAISCGTELVRCGYLYYMEQMSAGRAVKQIARTTAIGGGIAALYTYTTYGLAKFATMNAGTVVGRIASGAVSYSNSIAGVVLVTVSTCIDLYRWKNKSMDWRTVRENFLANAISTASSTAAVAGGALMLGAAATSWTGIGLLVLLGLGVGIGTAMAVRAVARHCEKKALMSKMHRTACDLLGLPRDNPAYNSEPEVINSRFRAITRFLHPDVANSRQDIESMFNIMTEAKKFLLHPSLNHDLLLNFQESSLMSDTNNDSENADDKEE